MRRRGRFLSVVLTGVLFCSTLTGCGNSYGESQEIKRVPKDSNKILEDVELTVWSEKSNINVTNKMVKSFEKKYGGEAKFDINVVEQDDGDAKNTMLNDVHGAADVLSIPDDQMLGLAASGAISPVENAEDVKNANLEGAVDAASYKNVLYAYPYSSDNGYFLYYNKKYFKDSDVKTLDKILSVAKKNGKKFEMQFDSGWYLYSFFGKTGLNFSINSDGVTNSCNWNSKTSDIKGVDIAEALLKLTSNPAFICQPDGEFLKNAKSDEVIAGISGVWNSVGIQKIWGKNYGACKLPTYTCAGKQVQMSSFKGYKMMCVNAYSKHLKWAHKLAEWLTNEENQSLRFEERNQGPSNKNIAASDEVRSVPAIKALMEQSQYGNLQRVAGCYWDATNAFASVMLEGNSQKKPLQKIMDELVEGITKTVAQ